MGEPLAGQPVPFAVMRYAHEVMRKCIIRMAALLEEEQASAFKREWKVYLRFLETHLFMEDEGVFKLFDELGEGAITRAGLVDEHRTEQKLEDAVSEAVGLDSIKAAFETWKEFHLQHLAHEESILVPLAKQTGSNALERGRVVHDWLLTPGERHGDLDWYLAYAIEILTRYGTMDAPPTEAVSVFAWGLQFASTPEQWEERKRIVEENTSAGIWDAMVRDLDIEGIGKVETPA